MRKKSIKYFVMCFLVISGSLSFGTVFAISRSDPKTEIAILYDPESDVTMKTKSLFSQLISRPYLDIVAIPVSSKVEFIENINAQREDFFAVVLIGHGDWLGISYGKDIIPWETVRDALEQTLTEKRIILSCYSEIVPLGVPEDKRDLYACFETEIDYMVATYSGACELANALKDGALFAQINANAANIKNNLYYRAVYSPEPLWSGETHKKIANSATTKLNLNNVPSSTKSEMIKTDTADSTDQVLGAKMTDILFNPVRLGLWLKHNYGVRGGTEVYFNVLWYKVYIKELCISLFSGTAPQAAQIAYDNAIYYDSIYNYAEAGKQLSYAAHYGQDMTQPYHVFDYLKYSVCISDPLGSLVAAINFVSGGLNDYYALPKHDAMEIWVDGNWDYIYSVQTIPTYYPNPPITSYGAGYYATNNFYIGTGPNAIYQAVTNLAIWTRGQMSRSTADSFNSYSSSAKRDLVKYFIAEAIDFSTALYQKFINAI